MTGRAVPAGLASLVLSVAVCSAPGANAAVEGPALQEPEGRYLEPVFDEVEVTSDIAYHDTVDVDGNPVTLYLDIYEPAGDTAEKRPVVVFMVGGFFVDANKTEFYVVEALEQLALTGYVGVAIEYRVRPDIGLFPDVDLEELEGANLDAYDDALAARDWLRDNAAEHRIEPEAIVPMGASAGGAIAWNLAWLQGSSARPEPSDVPAAVSVSGAPFPTSVVTGDDLAVPSPGDPPVLAFHGTEDDIIPFSLASGPCEAAAEVGVRCDLVAYEGGDHFVGLAQSEDIGEKTLAFLAEVVLEPLGYVDLEPPDEPPGTTVPQSDRQGPEDPQPDRPPDGSAPTPPPAEPVTGQPSFTG